MILISVYGGYKTTKFSKQLSSVPCLYKVKKNDGRDNQTTSVPTSVLLYPEVRYSTNHNIPNNIRNIDVIGVAWTFPAEVVAEQLTEPIVNALN